ncbi:MAG: hypothetical protein IAE82_10490 [Opitutaceae bacterium]|nr:hypothetical protein [Opitutaceae bacterium]
MKSPLVLLLLATAILASSAQLHAGPTTIRLYEIYAVRIVEDNAGIQTIERGRLDSRGGFHVVELAAFAPGTVAPPEALNRTLITTHTWNAYDILGTEAFANFEVTGPAIPIGGQSYFGVSASPDAKLDLGELVNISTRATVTPGADPVVGGFVVTELHRRVLIRGIGPGLARHGVATPLPDPHITLYRHGSNEGIAANDDWSQRPDAEEIAQVSMAIGAFSLSPGSKDAAYLIELSPGTYTVHLTTHGDTGGTALLEIYVIP